RVAELGEDLVDGGLTVGLGERAQADRREELARVGWNDRPRLQPRLRLGEARGAQALLGLLPGRVEPRARAADRADLGDVAVAAALGDEPPARLERGVERAEQTVVLGDPVEDRV